MRLLTPSEGTGRLTARGASGEPGCHLLGTTRARDEMGATVKLRTSSVPRVGALGTAGALLILLTGVATAGTASAVAVDQGPEIKSKICHATDADSNPYNLIPPDKSGQLNGHSGHTGPVWNDSLKDSHTQWGDIIPPFDYEGGSYPGLNWDAAGKAWWGNDCNEPPALGLTVEKTNDADGDHAFTDDETADTAGAAVDFTVVITNTSDVPVKVDSLTDAVGADPVSFTCDTPVENTVLDPDESVTCNFTVAAYTPADGASKVNTATATGHQAQTEGSPDNPYNSVSATDSNTVSTDVPAVVTEGSPDLSIAKTGPADAVPGDTLTWHLTVHNDGDAASEGATVTDALPTGVTFVSAGGTGWNCTGTTSISCSLTTTLDAGADAALTVVGTLSDTYDSETVSNTAVVGPTDDTPDDNTATAVTDVTLPQEPTQGGGGTTTDTGGTTTATDGGGSTFTGGGGTLAFTGARTDFLASVAAGMLLLGMALLVAGRRRTAEG